MDGPCPLRDNSTVIKDLLPEIWRGPRLQKVFGRGVRFGSEPHEWR